MQIFTKYLEVLASLQRAGVPLSDMDKARLTVRAYKPSWYVGAQDNVTKVTEPGK